MRFALLSIITLAACLLSGCAVYMPMQCAAPQITAEKQAEVTGSTYINGRFEIAANYSPVRHLLVRAAYGQLSDKASDTSNYYKGHQYEVAVGTYWPLGPRGLVGGLGGFGQARSQAHYAEIFLLADKIEHVFDAHYDKLFGEVYGAFRVNNVFSLGAAYRVTQVHFTSLTDEQVPFGVNNMTRSEPMLFFRTRFGHGPAEARPIQVQANVGSSTTFGFKPVAYSGAQYEVKKSRLYITVGVSLFPHCLFASSLK